MVDLLANYGVFIILGLILVFTGLFTVKQQTAYVIERLGKFQSIRQAGLQFK
ncbi:MAG: regulator of protease activity HflC (stomatin/prohibitin superfamily), partial [Saprospiraceae bacterium]